MDKCRPGMIAQAELGVALSKDQVAGKGEQQSGAGHFRCPELVGAPGVPNGKKKCALLR